MKLFVTLATLVLTFSLWASDVVNINSASNEELTALKGIGPVLAERIIQYRENHGSFSTLEELDHVKGISSDWVEKNKEHLSLSQ